MKNVQITSSRLASFLYKLEKIEHLHSGNATFHHDTSLYGMLLFKEAKGDIRMDGRVYPLHRQKVFLLSPGVTVELQIPSECQGDYFYIQFHVLRAASQGHFVPAELNGPSEWVVTHVPFWIDQVEEIARKQNSKNVWDVMKANIYFQEMIVRLFMDGIHAPKQDMNQAINFSLEYMKQNYQMDISREKLAEMAGVNADYFARMFKQKVGKSPMEYLTDIRINQAKQLLLQSDGSFRSIANHVGFSDEFYFSRKFKAKTGYSPTIYVKNIKYSTKIASMKHLPTGHLLALGIEPYAAVINNAFPITNRFRNTIDVGTSSPDLEKLFEAKPDLIVTCASRDTDKSPKEHMFNQIAQTITLPYFQNWRDHFRVIAKIVGREKESNDWLDRYEKKVQTIHKQIKPKVEDKTVLIVGIGKGKMCVYGQRNLGTVLYGDLQMAMPKGVAEIAHYKEITLANLFDFDADLIFLTSYKHDGTVQMDETIQSEVISLFANEQWQALKSVRNQSIYQLYDSRHLYTSYNALSHDLLLDKVHELVMSESSK